ncbi:PREDICTED: homeobox protein ESX1-like [Theobroma cacao]|uniref:Homeobox protein ESX1-like n=1 Tax=Theobroma cacao TaxID=3641 RepID=A0AB32WLK8_THECC|nr:PREDICTED: homeobox protein ESX1-like [Theobroma cacao]
MPIEAAQALAAFFTAMAGGAPTGQVPPIVPPVTPLVPPPQDAVGEESAASTIRAAPAAEQADSPPHPPPAPPPTGIPTMPTEAAQALAAFFTAMAGGDPTGQVPPIVPPVTPLVPPPTGHIRSNCPRLGRATVVASFSPAHTDMQRRDSSGLPPRQGVAIRSGVESNTPAHPPSRP